MAKRRLAALVVFGFALFGATALGQEQIAGRLDDVDEIATVAKTRILEFGVLWDQECLLSHEFFGLRIGTENSHKIKFFYGSPRQLANLQRGTITAMAEIPIRDGQVHGKVRRWAEDGILLLEVPFVKGKIHGECRFYSLGGKLLGTSTLDNGTGTYKVWSASCEDPTLVREIKYVDGKIVSPR